MPIQSRKDHARIHECTQCGRKELYSDDLIEKNALNICYMCAAECQHCGRADAPDGELIWSNQHASGDWMAICPACTGEKDICDDCGTWVKVEDIREVRDEGKRPRYVCEETCADSAQARMDRSYINSIRDTLDQGDPFA